MIQSFAHSQGLLGLSFLPKLTFFPFLCALDERRDCGDSPTSGAASESHPGHPNGHLEEAGHGRSFQGAFTGQERELDPSELIQSLSKACHNIKYSHEVQPNSSSVQLILAASRKVRIMAN